MGSKGEEGQKLTPRLAFQMTKKIGFYDQLGTSREKMCLRTDYLGMILGLVELKALVEPGGSEVR